ncbi:uncharacterized protein F4812DRAFT_419477 [Daldinia caldariorum]|uniref:uncharacterized protein n=1 Tax=Daldinia caldariorum TaxID=326644 RepID=UPI002007DA7D|nr:uncharacterized protein F4812DRAFT_419477 [Daldinia caldariorum]KAI1470924.1 hypothetical protein F4812DRAFT_419477 [Daldinia caldariorum]
MASYTASRESVSLLPGSFPTDDTIAAQDPSLASSDSHHNKLHKREDPRGWSDEEKAARKHQHTDSAIELTDPDQTLQPNSHARDRVNEGTLQSNNVTVRDSDVVPGTSSPSTTRSPNYQGNDSKPGFMTGAVDSHNANSASNPYPKTTTEDISSQNQTSSRGIGAVGPATGIATASTTDNTQPEQSPENRNTIRNGLRQTSNVEHQDPYWGDAPRGTGIYNTVTGHGSPETATEGSIQNHGPSLSHGQQRAFPLVLSSNAARDEATNPSGSRFKEGLDESTTGVAAGLTTSELAGTRRDHQHKDDVREPVSHKPHEADAKKESRIGGLFHRDHKDEKDIKSESRLEPVPSKDNRPLTERDAGVALAAATGAYGAKGHSDKHVKKARDLEHGVPDDKVNALYQHPNEKIDSDDPFVAAGYMRHGSKDTRKITNSYTPAEDVAMRDHSLASQATGKPNERNDSKLGYGLAAAGVGAGVGAGAGYAAHEPAHRDSEMNKVHPNQQKFHESTPKHSHATAQPSESTYVIGQPQLAVLPERGVISDPSEREQSLPHTSSSANRSLDNPSRHGEYNIPPGGTSSGISIGDYHDDKKNVVDSSLNTTHDASARDNHTGAKAAVAGASVAGAGAAARYTGQRHSNASSGVSGASGPAATDSTSSNTYRTLPTGTPSGINVDHSQQHGQRNVATSSPVAHGSVDNNNKHSGTKAAAGAAGVLGAGAAAKQHHHHSHRTSNDHISTPSRASRDYRSPAAAATASSSGSRASTDSSHGGQYNVLSSGTPSGINIGERDDVGRKNFLDSVPSPSKAKGSTARTSTAHPATTPAAAAAPVQEVWRGE